MVLQPFPKCQQRVGAKFWHTWPSARFPRISLLEPLLQQETLDSRSWQHLTLPRRPKNSTPNSQMEDWQWWPSSACSFRRCKLFIQLFWSKISYHVFSKVLRDIFIKSPLSWCLRDTSQHLSSWIVETLTMDDDTEMVESNQKHLTRAIKNIWFFSLCMGACTEEMKILLFVWAHPVKIAGRLDRKRLGGLGQLHRFALAVGWCRHHMMRLTGPVSWIVIIEQIDYKTFRIWNICKSPLVQQENKIYNLIEYVLFYSICWCPVYMHGFMLFSKTSFFFSHFLIQLPALLAGIVHWKHTVHIYLYYSCT